MKPQRVFLYSLVVSVIVSALLGIAALLGGGFGEFELRIVLTTVTIALGSVLGLACGVGRERRFGQVIPTVGIALTLLAVAMIILGIWAQLYDAPYWKLTASMVVWAVAFSHLTLISRAQLADRFRWSLWLAHVSIPVLAAQINGAIFYQPDGDLMIRVVGVTGILVAANTILVEIFHRLSRSETSARIRPPLRLDHAAIDKEIERLQARIEELEDQRRQA